MAKRTYVHGNADGYLDVRHVSVQDKKKIVTHRRAPRNARTHVMALDCELTLDQMQMLWDQGIR